MILGLHRLQRFPRSVHRPKRVGRGLGSGHGTMSTRGTKGQRARSGGTRGIGRRSIRQLILHLPKFKGQRRAAPKFATVGTAELERRFAAGRVVDGAALVAAGLIRSARQGVKILSDGKPMTKALLVAADAFSVPAKQAIEAVGGKAIILPPETGRRK